MRVMDIGEENIMGMFLSEPIRKGHRRKFRRGFNTTAKHKIDACTKFKELVENDKMKINSQLLISELKDFVASGMSYNIGQHDSPASTAVWYNGIGAIIFALLVSVQGLSLPTASSDLMILTLIGVLSSFQQFFIAFSHRVAPASALAPLRYLSIPVGILAGILFFGEVLTPQILIGSAVIVGSSIFILRREKLIRAAGAK